MDKELPSVPPAPNGFDEVDSLSEQVVKAITRTKERVRDEKLSDQAILLFKDIESLCLLNRHKVNKLMFLTYRLWAAVADFDFVGREFLESEIEYVRTEIKPLKDQAKN